MVAVVGAASLGAEIAAARLLAPWFGASTIVWANTIATVLVALSVGYWYGGRLADRDPTVHGMARIVLLAAGLLALVPFVAGPFLRVSVDALDRVEAGAFVGSLIGVLVLIAAPVFVLGVVAPYAVRLSVTAVDEAGRVAGRLYAISTLGSLAGVFLSALLFIPLLGTRRTFLVFALALAVVAAPGARTPLDPHPGRGRAAAARPGRDDQDGRRGEGRLGTRDRVPVRARRAGPGRGAAARAERGAGDPLRLPAGALADRQLLGRGARAAAGADRPCAALDRDPRERGRDHRPRLRALLPAHAGRRGRDRPRADQRRAAAVRPGRTEPAHAHRRRATVPAQLGPSLGRDPRRRLPPALHPVLSRHEGVLPARRGPPEPGRHRDRERRAPGAERRAREGPHRDDGRGVPVGSARPERARQHDARRPRLGPARGDGRRAARAAAARRGGDCAARSGRACAAAPSTPTTARLSSG